MYRLAECFIETCRTKTFSLREMCSNCTLHICLIIYGLREQKRDHIKAALPAIFCYSLSVLGKVILFLNNALQSFYFLKFTVTFQGKYCYITFVLIYKSGLGLLGLYTHCIYNCTYVRPILHQNVMQMNFRPVHIRLQNKK